MILVVTASETGRAHHVNLHICFFTVCRIVVWKSNVAAGVGQSLLEKSSWEGDTPILVYSSCAIIHAFWELSCLGLQLEVGGKFHLRLNICGSPIEHKYREGKMQRTLKRELKSTWNCCEVSKGNQCWILSDDVSCMQESSCGWTNVTISFTLQICCANCNPLLGYLVSASFAMSDWGQLLFTSGSVKMVFFVPSWNTDQGV